MLLTEFLVILALIAANGLFAGAEIAIVTLRKTRIEQLAAAGSRGARAVRALRSEPERFLATVQVGITIVGSTAAAFGGATFAEHLTPVLAQVPGLAVHAESVSLGLVIAGISYLSIVIGELVPKSLALRSAEGYALIVGRPLLLLSWLARPLVWTLSGSANAVLKPFGDQTTFVEARVTADELQSMVKEAGATGSIHPEAVEIASRALELPELTVSDIMVPRQDVVMLPVTARHEDVKRVLLEHCYSRLPVYDDQPDNVVGYITAKDLLAVAWESSLIVVADLVRPGYFVPERKPALELLNEMRSQQTPLAIVVDEHGGLSGIVTLEDVIEELVGELFSEHEVGESQRPRKAADGWVIVPGSAPIRELNRELEVELPTGDWATIAGLVLALSGNMPRVGEHVRTPEGVEIEVLDASARRVRLVRVRRAPEGA
jgi:putative hemolysin